MKKKHKNSEESEEYELSEADLKELGFSNEKIQYIDEQCDEDQIPYTEEELQHQARIVKASKKLKSAKIKLNLARATNAGLLIASVVSTAVQGFTPLSISLDVAMVASLGLTVVGTLKKVEARGEFHDFFRKYVDYLDELLDPFPEFREGYSEEKKIEEEGKFEEKNPPKQTEKTREL